MLKIYNSLSKQKEVFQPLQEGKVGIYVCGMTVYDHCHLGHARSMVSFDVVVRHLRARGYDVKYVRNITDIDDKIIERAAKNNEEVTSLTARFIDLMHQDEKALNILPPDVEPRATGYIEKIIAFIEGLIAKGFAYQASNGDVYYEVSKFDDYGKLSHKDIEGQEAGARVDVVDVKRAPLDFVLWKQAKAGEPAWPSPWGEGRPGWHIECSAMSNDCLGEQFDIHGGGFDLQFPHHENEIAQSEALHGKTFANLWMHVGFLQVNREKMSKSLGNFFTIEEVLKSYHRETVRYFLLSSHYRSQLNYSRENLNHAQTALERLYQSIRGVHWAKEQDVDQHWLERFNQAMDDDFNTPEALAVLFEITHLINRGGGDSPMLAATLKHLAGTLGLLEQDADAFLQAGIAEDEIERIEKLVDERLLARSEKNWQRADEIRDILQAEGIELEDGPEGTQWRHSSEL